MIIRSINLADYGRFECVEFEFQAGLTLIKGSNEAGKSTLQSAMMLALFGDPRSRSQIAGRRRRWGQDSYYNVALQYDFLDSSYRLEKDFDSRKERLSNLSTGEETVDRDAISAAISEAIGVSSEELLRSTACITQDNVARISGKGKQQISDELQNVITGGSDDTVATQSASLLLKKAAELRRGTEKPASNPGPIKQSEDTIARLKSDLAAAQDQLESLRQALDTAERAAGEIDSKSDCLRAIEALLTSCDKRFRLCAERDDAAKAEDALQAELEAIERLRYDVRKNKTSAQALERLSGLPSDTPQVLARLEAEVQSHKATEGANAEELTRLMDTTGKSNSLALRFAGLGAGLLLLLGAISLIFDSYLIGSVALFGSAGLLFWRQSLAAVARDHLRRLKDTQRRLEQVREQLGAANKNLQAMIDQCGCESSEALWNQLSERSRLERQSAEAEAELSGRLAGRDADDIEQERKRWSKARRDAEEELDLEDMRLADLTPLQRQQYDLQRSRLEAEIVELENQRIASRAIIDNSHIDPSHVYKIEENLAAEQDRLRRLERLAKVYSAAAEGIGEAVAQTISQAKERLEAQVGKYLSLLTGGKYKQVEVDERSLDFRIYSNEKGGTVDADGDDLSRGALDQFYLAARIALLDLICGESRAPLMLDDPFVTFDDIRAARAMELCRSISQQRQVMLFTCSGRYDEYADHVLEIQAAQAGQIAPYPGMRTIGFKNR